MSKLLTTEQAEQIAAEIDNQGFGYWVQEYGEIPNAELQKLSDNAKEALNALQKALEAEDAIWV